MTRFTIVISVLTILAGLCPPPVSAQSGRSDWDSSDYSRVRLLLLPADENGEFSGGVEIQLEPGWHTYWQVPGDAGVPPQFDFSKSVNVSNVSVDYPVPQRYDEGGSVSVIYNDRVVFPLNIEVIDPEEPVRLSVDMFYGACAEVCIPVKSAIATMVVPGNKADPLARIAIAEFREKLPGSPRPGFAVSSATVKNEKLVVSTSQPGSDRIDLFAKGPAEWFTGQPKLVERSGTGATFSLSLNGIPAGVDISGKFDLLLVSGEEGVLAKSVPVN